MLLLQAAISGHGYRDFRDFASGGQLQQLYQTVSIAQEMAALTMMSAAGSSLSPALGSAANVTTSSSSSDNQNPLANIQNFASALAKNGGLQPYLMGTAYSYGWWMVSFQFFMIVLGAAVVLKAPKKRFGLSALFAVLTASTFFFTCLVRLSSASAPFLLLLRGGSQHEPQLSALPLRRTSAPRSRRGGRPAARRQQRGGGGGVGRGQEG